MITPMSLDVSSKEWNPRLNISNHRNLFERNPKTDHEHLPRVVGIVEALILTAVLVSAPTWLPVLFFFYVTKLRSSKLN